MKRHRIIYCLSDPRTHEIRYIGKSVNGMRRASHHFYMKQARGHCANWVAALRRDGTRPDIDIIEEHIDDASLDDAERFWIAYFKSIGARLANATDGGEGWAIGDRNPMRDPESRRRYSVANKGRRFTDEHRKAISDGLKRHYSEPDNRARYAGDKNPARKPGVGARISIATKGKKREQLGRANKLRWARERAFRTSTQGSLNL